MLQSMIIHDCVRCVFIATTKCKAMRNIHHEEQDYQETSNLVSIFLYYLLYNSGPASTIKEKLTTRKNLHSVKYDTKKLKKLYWSGDNSGIIFYGIKNQKFTLFYCMKYFSIKRHFIFLAG